METTFELGYALDTFYFLICGALVMWMAAGFAMLEAGLVRAKNTTEILTKNIALFAIACTMYMICGYGIMYGGDDWSLFLSGIVGDGATDVAEDPATYAPSADFFFQVVFVATAMSIVSGAVAERMKLWAFLTFAVVMTGFIYPMEGAWTWGGVSVFGMYTLGDLGFSDFAGSGIVHMAGAAAALAGVLVLGARKGKYTADGKVNAIPGANLPLATLGTFILWMGWFGFNGGSALGANGSAGYALIVTQVAAAAAAISWLITEKLARGKASVLGGVSGAVAGLVVITPAAGFVTVGGALAMGLIGGVVCFWGITALKRVLKADDSLDAFGLHGVGGIVGAILTAFFASEFIMGDNAPANVMHQLWVQVEGVLATIAYSAIMTFIILKVIDLIIGIRVASDDERMGLDLSQHGERVE